MSLRDAARTDARNTDASPQGYSPSHAWSAPHHSSGERAPSDRPAPDATAPGPAVTRAGGDRAAQTPLPKAVLGVAGITKVSYLPNSLCAAPAAPRGRPGPRHSASSKDNPIPHQPLTFYHPMLIIINMPTELILHCNQCNYEWSQRGMETPKSCPRCKRYDWESPPKKGQHDA